MDNNVKVFVSVIGILIVGVIVTAILRTNTGPAEPGKYDTFAQCLKDTGVTFYGAFWCPNCQNQKKSFGTSAKLLPYVECSTLDAKGQLPACIEKSIQSYPTWEFADGSRTTGDLPLETIAEKSGCALPVEGEVTGETQVLPETPAPGASSEAIQE